MTISALRDLALAHGILILDYEDRETIRDRVNRRMGLSADDRTTISDAQIEAVTQELHAAQSDIVLLTETDEGAESLGDALRAAMRAVGLAAADEEDTEADVETDEDEA